MILKLLGILDIISALIFWIFGMFHIIPLNFILVIAFYLIIKGIIFSISLDAASVIDILVSILIFVSIGFALPKIIVFLIALYLIQKGVFSLL